MVLNASDPAFAAIKVFIDINNDGQVNDGEMQTPQLSSIDFTTGQINYTEGPSASLTATTLSGDTEGIKLDTIKVVDEDGKLQELEVGSVLVHEGYQGMVRVNSKGQIVADDDPTTDTHLVSQRINSYEFNAAHLTDWEGTAEQDQHRHGGTNVAGAPTETSVTGVSSMGAVLGKENVKTTTTMEEGDAVNRDLTFLVVPAKERSFTNCPQHFHCISGARKARSSRLKCSTSIETKAPQGQL